MIGPVLRPAGAWLLGGLTAATALLTGTVAADTGRAPAPGPSDPDAVRLLSRTEAALRATAFAGTESITTPYGTTTVDVSHAPGDGTIVRAGSLLVTAEAFAQSPALLAALTTNYALVQAGETTVSGRSALLLAARRPGGAIAARFWIDRATGILLRRELLDGDGGLVLAEGLTGFQTGFQTGEAVGVAGTPATFTPWRREPVPGTLWGWRVPRRLPAGLTLVDARSRSGGAVQLVYSDGLCAVSVFVQPGELDESRFAAWHRVGVSGHTVFETENEQRQAVWGSAGRVFTVLATAPVSVSDAVVAALPHQGNGPAGADLWQRLRRGARRLLGGLDSLR